MHTTAALWPNVNPLFDIFAGPREDFSNKPGWVVNADDSWSGIESRPRSGSRMENS
ncbi:hypothetical protein LVY72_22815 [Arthrobacter sp. I2-34]|uniref:Uncharacterized protein n=1 Tax=Arthrobacter hankyongi TaxID=2904801 RepID=A0ABS9LDG7_9MICC|nr:hypothetical protein [Arthrobacter hankyongi]MCG2624724.1 hypothetical protein [Arthrobacter hankyongi]